MRSRASDRRGEAFFAMRNLNATYQTGTGAGARRLYFDALQTDRTNGKLLYVSEARFVFTAAEYETWCFQLAVQLVGTSVSPDYICPYLFGPGSQARNLAIQTATVSSTAYKACGELVVVLNPGDTIEPGLNSINATNNNPSSACYFSGYRVA